MEPASAQQFRASRLLHGVAYYDEYMPVECLDKDVVKAAYDGLLYKSIAELTGFKSLSNFSRTFKRVTALSPSAYKQRIPSSYSD